MGEETAPTWAETARRGLRRVVAPRSAARAHSGVDSYVYVVVDEGGITGNVQFPIADLNAVLGLAIPHDDVGARNGTDENLATIQDYAAEHLTIGTGEVDWSLVFVGRRVLERKAGSYTILEYRVAERLDLMPRRFTVWYDGIIHAKPKRSALVIVKTSAGWGGLRTVTEERLPFAAGSTFRDVIIPEPSARRDLGGAAAFITARTKDLLRRARKRLRR